MISRSVESSPLPTTFADLCARHWPRPIHDEMDYDNTAEMVDRLAVMEKRTRDQDEYLETLTILIEKYDQEYFARSSGGTPARRLKHLLELHEMSASDLGRLLGNRSLGSAILRGERKISKANAAKLASHFKLSTGAFV